MESLKQGLEIGFLIFFILMGLFHIQMLHQGIQTQQEHLYGIWHTERFLTEVM